MLHNIVSNRRGAPCSSDRITTIRGCSTIQNGVVKRGRLRCEIKGFVKALSAGPPVLLRNGESTSHGRLVWFAVRRDFASGCDDRHMHAASKCFTTGVLVMVKRLWRGKWLAGQEIGGTCIVFRGL